MQKEKTLIQRLAENSLQIYILTAMLTNLRKSKVLSSILNAIVFKTSLLDEMIEVIENKKTELLATNRTLLYANPELTKELPQALLDRGFLSRQEIHEGKVEFLINDEQCVLILSECTEGMPFTIKKGIDFDSIQCSEIKCSKELLTKIKLIDTIRKEG
jgi:hypothetical protein